MHAIFRCPFMRDVWRGHGVKLPNKRTEDDDSMQFLSDLFYLNECKLKEDLVAIAWGIWRKRCDYIDDGGVCRRPKIVFSYQEVN